MTFRRHRHHQCQSVETIGSGPNAPAIFREVLLAGKCGLHRQSSSVSRFTAGSRSRDRPPSCSSPGSGDANDAAVTRAARRWDPRQRKRSEALRLEPRASISQAVGARRNPSPRASAVARFRDCVRSTQRRRGVGARRDIAVRARAARPRRLRHGQRPWSGAVVVMSAGAEGKGRFHGSISVSDTIGTLLPPHLEIVTLFRLAYCCVMGRKAPRKRLACRVMCRPNGCFAGTRTSLGAPPTPRLGVGEATMQTPGAKTRRGNDGVRVVDTKPRIISPSGRPRESGDP